MNSNPNFRSRNNQPGQPHPFSKAQQPGQIQLPGAIIMVGGLKADYHVQKHAAKQQRYPLDAGIDIYPSRGELDIEPLSKSYSLIYIPTAVSMTVGPGMMCWLMARSSTVTTLCGALVLPSCIDAHYAGEMKIRVQCFNQDIDQVKEAIAKAAEKEIALAQLIVTGYFGAIFTKMDTEILLQLTRGTNGYGSTNPK